MMGICRFAILCAGLLTVGASPRGIGSWHELGEAVRLWQTRSGCSTIYNDKTVTLIVFVPKELPWLTQNIGKLSGEPKKKTEEGESTNI